MACSSVAPCALAPTFSRATSATRASPSSFRAPTLLKGTPFLGGELAQSAQGAKMLRSRPASIARAQAVLTSAPKVVTKGDSADEWLELHKWAGLLPPEGNGKKLTDNLKNEIIKYGEMAQLTYDSVDLYEWSRYRDQNRFTEEVDGKKKPGKLFGDNLKSESHFQHLQKGDYEAIAYMYASEETPTIRMLRKKTNGQEIKKDVWIGYIAYSKAKGDIVVAWRGTQQPAEWVSDAEVSLISYKKYVPDPPKKWNPLTFLLKAGYKTGWAAVAFGGAMIVGGVAAFLIATILYCVFFRWVESESLLGAALNTAFAAAAALPLYKFFLGPLYEFILERFFKHDDEDDAAKIAELLAKPAGAKVEGSAEQGGAKIEESAKAKEDKVDNKMENFVLLWAVAALISTGIANWQTSTDQFFTVDALRFLIFVLLPTGATAAVEAWQSAGDVPQVHEGFFELYDPTVDKKKAQKLPEGSMYPRKVVHETLKQLLTKYSDASEIDPQEAQNPVRTISVTGHSLGGALAVLSAYDIVESGCNKRPDGERIPVACFAFEAPRVGNPTFKDSFEAKHADGLAAIRVVNKPDIVTQVPKAFFLQNVYYLLAAITNFDRMVNFINWVEELGYRWKLPSAFQHPGKELVHDSRDVDYLKKMPGINPLNNIGAIGYYHNLELNLHMVSGLGGKEFRPSRDFALCNKSSDVIDERAGIPPNWFASAIQRVVPAKPGGALIEEYSTELLPKDGADNKRKNGEGPAVPVPVAPGSETKILKCQPLESDYFVKYGIDKPRLESWWDKFVEIVFTGRKP